MDGVCRVFMPVQLACEFRGRYLTIVDLYDYIITGKVVL
jgi:hypothetical protein